MNHKINRTLEFARLLQPEKQTGRSFHVTAAFQKSKMIAIATNDYSHPHLAHLFGEYKPTKGDYHHYVSGRHSEAEILKKLKNADTSKLVFVNVRLGKNGVPMMARCCPNCERLMREKGFKEVLYTISENEFGTMY
jgi:hypothetical protein